MYVSCVIVYVYIICVNTLSLPHSLSPSSYITFPMQVLIGLCWQRDPARRPTISSIIQHLTKCEQELIASTSYKASPPSTASYTAGVSGRGAGGGHHEESLLKRMLHIFSHSTH